ncbi:UNVERIFIED_CONTAM: hypothetical protein Slati_2079300 [Sesamum latifolium]|uniref:Uncharacterized protein n=1 Tax=Sesamum latifolium TaxID=2727402 RepID=A0AAW2WSB0_9LAMI
MGLTWKEEHLDFVLVPSGLLIMLGYHLFHLHRCINLPETTVIGYENHNRRAWVARILQLEAKERSQAITTARCFVHANFLISTPNCEMPVRNVESAVISGSNLGSWSEITLFCHQFAAVDLWSNPDVCLLCDNRAVVTLPG